MGYGFAALAIASMAAQPMRPLVVVGSSMAPTYVNGTLLLTVPVDRPLRRGDVVVADTPSGPVIKRVALLAGDRRRQWPTGDGWVDTIGMREPRRHSARGRVQTVPSGTVFLLGDNLPYSIDSRSFGPVPLERIVRLVVSPRAPDSNSKTASEDARRWLAVASSPEQRT